MRPISGEVGPMRNAMTYVAIAASAAGVLGSAACADTDSSSMIRETQPTVTAVDSASCGVGQGLAGACETDADPTTTTTEVVVDCEDTWIMPGLPTNEKHRVVLDGIPELGTATNADESRAAVAKWFDVISQDPDLLGGYAVEILGTPVDTATLVDAEGCATDVADDTRLKMEMDLANGTISNGSVEVPADATNTGVDANGAVVAATSAGISGDRIGVTITKEDGTVLGIMRRCGNFVMRRSVPTPPRIPTGETDEYKTDRNTSPGGNTGHNGGSGTTQEPGPKGPGKGKAGTVDPSPQGSGKDEVVVPAPTEEKTTSDTDSKTGTPAPQPGVEQAPAQGGSGAPAEAPKEVPVDGGQGGTTDPNNA